MSILEGPPYRARWDEELKHSPTNPCTKHTECGDEEEMEQNEVAGVRGPDDSECPGIDGSSELGTAGKDGERIGKFRLRPCQIGFWRKDCRAPEAKTGYQPSYVECSLDPWHQDAFDGVLGSPPGPLEGAQELIIAGDVVTQDRPERKKVCAAVDYCGNMVGTVAVCDDVKRVMDILKRTTTATTSEDVVALVEELQEFLNTCDGRNLIISRISELQSQKNCDDAKTCDGKDEL